MTTKPSQLAPSTTCHDSAICLISAEFAGHARTVEVLWGFPRSLTKSLTKCTVGVFNNNNKMFRINQYGTTLLEDWCEVYWNWIS